MEPLFWDYSFSEIQQKIQLKYGFANAGLLSQHNSVAMVINQALGGGKKSAPLTIHDPGVKNVTAGARSAEDAILAMNRMLSFG